MSGLRERVAPEDSAGRCVGLPAVWGWRRHHLYFIHVRETTVTCHALLVRVDTEDALQVRLNQVVSGRHHAVWRDAVLVTPVECRPEGVALVVVRLQVGAACGQHACLHAERPVSHRSAPHGWDEERAATGSDECEHVVVPTTVETKCKMRSYNLHLALVQSWQPRKFASLCHHGALREI